MNLTELTIAQTNAGNLTLAAELLRYVKHYPKQKGDGSPQAPRDNVRDAFEVIADVEGKKIVAWSITSRRASPH